MVVCKQASPTVRLAARELQKYLDRIAGVRVQIAEDGGEVQGPRILLSSANRPNRQAASLPQEVKLGTAGSDRFVLSSTKDGLLIAGASDRAVLFGVYEFLEQKGCRWFGPLEEHVPSSGSFSLACQETSAAPGLRWRGLELIAGSDPAVVDWMAKARLNVAWPEKYTPNPDLTVNEAGLKAAAIPEMQERGLTIFWGGHILPLLFSSKRYADHPEYFAEIKGKRLDPAVKDEQGRWQICTGNPDAMRILIENTITFLRNHPWIDVLFLWGNDTPQWCECKLCRALEKHPDRPSSFGGMNRSATYCRMIKLVQEAVARALPGRRLGFNHYYNLEDPPDDLSVLPPKTSLSAVDVYRQCDRHAFTDSNCPAAKRIEPLARLWGRHYQDSVSWSYYWSWNFMKGLPLSLVHKIPEDFKFLQALGIQGNLDNVSLVPSTLGHYDPRPGICATDHWRYNVLNFYIYARAAWNPSLDVDAVFKDFVAQYYGPAAEPMRRFWDLMEAATVKFGQDPGFMPEDKKLANPKVYHTWFANIRHLVPNQRVYDELESLLRTARHRAASAYGQPLKAEAMPYLDRVQLLERALAGWEDTAADAKYDHK